MTIKKLLIAIIVLQSMLVAGQWLGGPTLPAAGAQARVVDPGIQRQQMIDEQKKTNERLSALITLLENGDLQVRVEQADAR